MLFPDLINNEIDAIASHITGPKRLFNELMSYFLILSDFLHFYQFPVEPILCQQLFMASSFHDLSFL